MKREAALNVVTKWSGDHEGTPMKKRFGFALMVARYARFCQDMSLKSRFLPSFEFSQLKCRFFIAQNVTRRQSY